VARSHTANTCPEGQMFSAGSNGSTSGLSLKQTKRELTTKTPLRRDNNPITGDMAVPVNGRTERLKPTIGLWIQKLLGSASGREGSVALAVGQSKWLASLLPI